MKPKLDQIGPMISRKEFLLSGIALAAAPVLSRAAKPAAAPKGKRIGFVDDDLNNYHANVFLQALRGPLKARGFVVAGCTGLKKAEGRAWAEKNNVPWFDSAAALNEAVDFYMVLAPSTPETHLELSRWVAPFGKPIYVDKTFAPNFQTAEQIFALADAHKAPLQTTSALRYTNVQEEVRKLAPAQVEHMITWGGGGTFAEYAIHPLELLISVMGHEAMALMRRGTEPRSQLLINFSGGRTGVANVYTRGNTPFAASITTGKGTKYIEVDVSKIFVENMAGLLDFFEAGKTNIDRRESLAIMRILDTAADPRALKEFVPLH
jgi:predicted dehydrogenase